MLQWNMTSSCYYFCTVVLTRNHLFAVRDKAVYHLTRPAKESYQLFGGLERRGGGEVWRCGGVCGVCVCVCARTPTWTGFGASSSNCCHCTETDVRAGWKALDSCERTLRSHFDLVLESKYSPHPPPFLAIALRR